MSNREKLPSSLYFQIFDTKRTKSELIKIKILEAVIDCLATQGLEATTFESIGKIVNMERAHVNYYFSSRKELIKGAVRYAVATGQQIIIRNVKKANHWKDRLKIVIDGPFEWLSQYPKHFSVMSLFYYLCTHDEDMRQLQNVIQKGGEDRIAATLDVLVHNGQLTQTKIKEISRAVQSMISGNIHYFFTSDYGWSMKQVRTKTVQMAVDLVTSQLSE
ncbi:MAG: TetR family transcriptional regulator [Deltaproteobacteria bacterium]|nr:TetR family transcriptional regulator [Deltaproteobacteria bacterium]